MQRNTVNQYGQRTHTIISQMILRYQAQPISVKGWQPLEDSSPIHSYEV